MNLQELWSGTEYAYLPNRPRGVDAPMGARRVKVIRAYKERGYGSERATGYVDIEIMDEYDNTVHNYQTQYLRMGRTEKARARDIINFWEDYYAEIQERLEARRRAREVEEAAKRERTERDARFKQAFSQKTGIPLDWIEFGSAEFRVLNTREVMDWMGVSE